MEGRGGEEGGKGRREGRGGGRGGRGGEGRREGREGRGGGRGGEDTVLLVDFDQLVLQTCFCEDSCLLKVPHTAVEDNIMHA